MIGLKNYRILRHNFGRFPEHETMFEAKYKEFKIILSELFDKRVMGAQHRYFQAEFKKFDSWFGNYQELWEIYFVF